MTAFTKLLFLHFSLQVDVRKPWVLLHKIFYWNHLSDIISVLRRHVVDPGWSDKTDQYIFPIQILELSRHLVRAEQSHIRPINFFGTTNKSWFNVSIVGILSLPALMYERTNFEYGILKRKLQTFHTNYRKHGCNSQFKRSMSQISSIKLRRSNILYSWHKAHMQNIELCS